ncbi:hypothetical protein [Mycolicibacterium sp. S3B2]|uniref:hypothetical protein n=1 Tax=Mycolicibacterium sp. S3B2 TaxID=3415120 RepID=UPI003C7EC055
MDQQGWLYDYQRWIERLCDTHDSVRYTIGHRLRDFDRAERLSVQVVLHMLGKPNVFRYQGLPYSARIGSVAETLLAAKPADDEKSPDWPTVVAYLEQMPVPLRLVHVGAFIHGVADDDLIGALGSTTTASLSRLRIEVQDYLASAATPGDMGRQKEKPCT